MTIKKANGNQSAKRKRVAPKIKGKIIIAGPAAKLGAEKLKEKKNTSSKTPSAPTSTSTSVTEATTKEGATEPKKKRPFFNVNEYQQRLEATNPGCKPIPEGKRLCLDKKSFVITGALESLHRTEVVDLIKQYGGLIRTNISSRTNFVIVGQEPAPGKVSLMEKHKTKQLTEDDLFAMISNSK